LICCPCLARAIVFTVEIVRAQPVAAPVLSAIAWAAKASWGYPTPWMEQWRRELTITPEFIAENHTFLAHSNGQTIGFHTLIEEIGSWRLEHLWVLPEQMGRGCGRRLFAHAAAYAAERGALFLTIEADPNAEPFYRRMGATRLGTRESQLDGGQRSIPLLRFVLI
jgi:GNAT superfamily N-acetyltransferase